MQNPIDKQHVSERFQEDGFYFPLDAMSPEKAMEYRAQLEALESRAARSPVTVVVGQGKRRIGAVQVKNIVAAVGRHRAGVSGGPIGTDRSAPSGAEDGVTDLVRQLTQ